ncbi:rCG28631 [Rattus norvegicus]|uniref:RCG28631 n=1 Tax=Rattus norvegicus TaxID=10116 RepID=A6HWM2_RAT|nr:rCG28631 [Rattus norvegicus]
MPVWFSRSLSIFIPLLSHPPGESLRPCFSLPCRGSQRLAPGMFRSLEPSVSCPGSVWATVLSPGLTLSPRECGQATVCCPLWEPISGRCSGGSLHPEPSLKRET